MLPVRFAAAAVHRLDHHGELPGGPGSADGAGLSPYRFDYAFDAVGADTYGYDADGQLTGRTVSGKADTLAWNDTGTLGSVTGTTSFVYDADGTRLIRRDPTATTLYIGTSATTPSRSSPAR